LFLDGSTFAVRVSGNDALNGDGGGVLVINNGYLPGGAPPITELLNTRITGNTAVGVGAASGRGGGIAVLGVMEVNADTDVKVDLNGQTAAAPTTAPFKLGVYFDAAVVGTFPANANVTNDNYQIVIPPP
jgi:hypothetical protein